MKQTLTLTPGQVTLADLCRIYREPVGIQLDRACQPRVEAASKIVQLASVADVAVYGINTGFGKLASTRIPAAQTEQLQRNLIRSHCCGVGKPLAGNIVRLIMVLKMISLGRGASGVRWQISTTGSKFGRQPRWVDRCRDRSPKGRRDAREGRAPGAVVRGRLAEMGQDAADRAGRSPAERSPVVRDPDGTGTPAGPPRRCRWQRR